jgi:hypothetical protein
MYRVELARVALALSFVLAGLSSALAVNDPSGTISCAVTGRYYFFRPYLPTVPAGPGTRAIRTKIIRVPGTACDNAGVTGGRAPISAAEVSLSGRLAAGTTCADFLTSLTFEKARIKVAWQRFRPDGHRANVATSKAVVASATYDAGSEDMVIVTQPVAKGAFAGSTLTLHLGVGDPVAFDDQCNTLDASYTGLFFGDDNDLYTPNASSVSVP